jgi:tRNA(Ile)-lysidine synthase
LGLSELLKKDLILTERFLSAFGDLWSGKPQGLVIAACSGGPDSMALLDLLASGRDVYGYTLAAAYLDHGLRGDEGKKDAQAVKAFCDRMGASFFTDSADCRKQAQDGSLSLEDACRQVRYNFLNRIRMDTGATAVATGHTADDNAETVLMNILRGAGSRGLAGIPRQRGWLIRPLLGFWREELLAYLSAKGISYREDKTNLDESFFRNRVRHRLIPVLEQDYNPAVKRGLAQTADIFEKEEEIWRDVLAEAQHASGWQQGDEYVSMDLARFEKQKPAVQRRLIREGLTGSRDYLRGVSFDHVESVLDTAAKGSGAVDLTGDRRAWVSGGRLYLGRKVSEAPPVEATLPLPGRVCVTGLDVEVSAEVMDESWPDPKSTGSERSILDLDKIKPPLAVRNMRPGDRFRPLGMDGAKKLSDFFIDLKVPRHLRSYVPLVVDRDGVVLVAGYRPSERVKVDSSTKRVVILTIGRTA